jgi:TldD protein
MAEKKVAVENPIAGAFERFEVHAGILAEVMAEGMSRGGDFCELYFQDRRKTNLSLEDHEVRWGSVDILRGVGIRVLKGSQTGYSHSSDMSREALLRSARMAGLIADSGKSARPAPIVPPGSGAALRGVPTRYYPGCDDSQDTGKFKDWLVSLDKRIFECDRRVVKAACGGYSTSEIIFIVNSEGLAVFDDRPQFIAWANCIAESGGRRESSGSNAGKRENQGAFMDDALLRRLADETVARTVGLFDAVEASGGEMPLVLGSGEGGILVHESMGHGFEADFIRKGTSIFSGRMGDTCAPECVSIIDSGTMPGLWGSINVDDEGVSGKETVLVEKGRIVSWLHDRLSAAHFKCAPTGNGRRQDYRCAPEPRMRSTYIGKGPYARDEIIASVKKGIYAERFTNGQVNIGQGDFTFYMKSGYLIEDGKLASPVKDVNIIGNGPRVLSEIEMVGDDLRIMETPGMCGKDGQAVPVSDGTPTLKVKSITVGGRK